MGQASPVYRFCLGSFCLHVVKSPMECIEFSIPGQQPDRLSSGCPLLPGGRFSFYCLLQLGGCFRECRGETFLPWANLYHGYPFLFSIYGILESFPLCIVQMLPAQPLSCLFSRKRGTFFPLGWVGTLLIVAPDVDFARCFHTWFHLLLFPNPPPRRSSVSFLFCFRWVRFFFAAAVFLLFDWHQVYKTVHPPLLFFSVSRLFSWIGFLSFSSLCPFPFFRENCFCLLGTQRCFEQIPFFPVVLSFL